MIINGTQEDDDVDYGRMYPHSLNLRYGTLTRKRLITNESKRSVNSNFHSSEPPLLTAKRIF